MTSTTSAAPNGLGAIPNMATGNFTSDGDSVSIVLGFNPRYFKLFDETDVILYEKVQGDLPANYWKTVTAGTTTLATDSGITFPADTGLAEPGSSVLLSAAVAGTGKSLSWVAFG